MRFDIQYSTMSPVLHLDILYLLLITDIVGENINLLKELALVCHSSRSVAIINLPLSNLMRIGFQRRRDSSSYLKGGHTLSSISGNYRIKLALPISSTIMICFYCLFSLHLWTRLGSIYLIWAGCLDLFINGKWCLNFMNSMLQSLPGWRGSC